MNYFNLELDKQGFVFIYKESAYWVALWGGEPWLSRWVDNLQNWVSSRSLTTFEVNFYRQIAIPEDQANIYHELSGTLFENEKDDTNRDLPKS